MSGVLLWLSEQTNTLRKGKTKLKWPFWKGQGEHGTAS